MNAQSPIHLRRRAIRTVLPFTEGPPARAVAALLFAAALTCFGAPQEKPAEKPADKPAEAAAAEPKKPAEYMGSAVCMGCHEEIYNNFLKRNAHRTLETNKKRGWEEKACEACHGPGSNHAESASAADIQNPARLQPGKADRVCLKCHVNTPTQVGRVMSGHARGQVRCADCHSVHSPEPKNSVWQGMPVLPGAVNSTPSKTTLARTGTCVKCHTGAWAEFQRPHRHKVPEGAMNCTDCHNPHGGTNRTMQFNAGMNEPGCFKCHTDKRGPFTFEHAPMRTDGCVACHQPHGSANPKMMTRSEVRFQCLECHTNTSAAANAQTAPSGGLGVMPPAIHDLRQPRFRNCTLCHIKIHGSHVNRDFTR